MPLLPSIGRIPQFLLASPRKFRYSLCFQRNFASEKGSFCPKSKCWNQSERQNPSNNKSVKKNTRKVLSAFVRTIRTPRSAAFCRFIVCAHSIIHFCLFFSALFARSLAYSLSPISHIGSGCIYKFTGCILAVFAVYGHCARIKYDFNRVPLWQIPAFAEWPEKPASIRWFESIALSGKTRVNMPMPMRTQQHSKCTLLCINMQREAKTIRRWLWPTWQIFVYDRSVCTRSFLVKQQGMRAPWARARSARFNGRKIEFSTSSSGSAAAVVVLLGGKIELFIPRNRATSMHIMNHRDIMSACNRDILCERRGCLCSVVLFNGNLLFLPTYRYDYIMPLQYHTGHYVHCLFYAVGACVRHSIEQ